MKGELQKRPKSKQIGAMRPITTQVSEANKKLSDECFQMGKKHMGNKEYPEALRHYFNATIHDPSNFKAFCNMGSILKELGNYKQSKKAYLRALMAKSDDCITLYNFGNLNRVSGDEDASIPLYQKIISLHQVEKKQVGNLYPNSLLNMGICYQNVGNFDQAIQCFNKYIKINPNEESGYFNKTMCILKKITKTSSEKYSKVRQLLCNQAEQFCQQALKINKQNLTTKICVIQLKYLRNPSQSEYAAAIQEYKKLQNELKNKPHRDDDQEYINIKIGLCYANLKKAQESADTKKNSTVIKENANNAKNIQSQKIKNNAENTENKYDSAKEGTEEKQSIAKNIRPSSKTNNIRPSSKENRPKTKGSGRSIPLSRKESQSGAQDQFQKLLNQGQYKQAFEIVNKLPDGLQKYEKQIWVNLLNAQQAGEQLYLRTAKQIYDQKIVGNSQSVQKQTCSRNGHELCALLLVELKQYQQATKHYEILMQVLQDEKLLATSSAPQKSQQEQIEIERIRGELGILYAQQKMFVQAIQEFKKNMELHPKDYSIMSNICLCLIESNQQDEALRLYDSYLDSNYPNHKKEQNLKIQSEEQKAIYIDCKINIAICKRENEQELQILRNTKNEIQRLYPTYSDITKVFPDVNNLLGIYLRLTQLLEIKVDGVPFSKAKEQNQQLLDSYLGCLQYAECPDRTQILTNCGILFYLSGCYANAYMIYSQLLHIPSSYNDIGLTLAHLEDFESALIHLQTATENDPESVMYWANFEILKWICGLLEQCSENKLSKQIPCKCEHLVYQRALYGLGLIDHLTQILSLHPEKVQRNTKIPIQKQTKQLLDFLYTDFNSQQQNKRNKFISNYMQKHIKNFPVHDSTKQIKLPLIPSNLMIEQGLFPHKILSYKTFYSKVQQFLKTLPPNPYYVSFIQLFMSTGFIVDRTQKTCDFNVIIATRSQHCTSHAIDKAPQEFKKDPTNSKYALGDYHEIYQELDSEELSKQQVKNFKYTVPIKYPNTDINQRSFGKWIRDIQCSIQNNIQMLIEYIESLYYESQGILEPIHKQIKYPHCQNINECESCYIKALRTFSTFFEVSQDQSEVKLNKQHNYKYTLQKMKSSFYEYTKLYIHKSGIYQKSKAQVQLEITPFNSPTVMSGHFKKFEDLQKFLLKVDPSFSVKLHQGDCEDKGVRNLFINKRLVIKLWWGQIRQNLQQNTQNAEKTLTYFDKYGNWWQQVLTSYAYEGLIVLNHGTTIPNPTKKQNSGEDNENGEEKNIPQGIKAMKYLFQDGEKVYEKAKNILLGIQNS